MKRRIGKSYIILGIVSVVVLLAWLAYDFWSINGIPEEVMSGAAIMALWGIFDAIRSLVKKRMLEFFLDIGLTIVYAIMFVTAADLI